MTLIQGHGIPSTQRQQLLGVLSRSELVVKSAGPDTKFDSVHMKP